MFGGSGTTSRAALASHEAASAGHLVASVLAVVACCAHAQGAAAQRASVQTVPVEWTGPSECPSLDDVRGMLEAVVPDEVRARLDGTSATIRLEATSTGYRAQIHVRRGTFAGEREVEGRRCEDVARSAIIVVSVALTEAVNAPEDEPPMEPIEPIEPIAAPPAEPQSGLASEPAVDARRFGVDIGLGVASGIGTRPVTPRVSIAGRLELGRAALVGLRMSVAPLATIDDGNDRVGRISVVTFAPELCAYASQRRSLRLGACFDLDAGLAVAHGTSSIGGRRGAAPWLSVAALPMAEIGDRVRLRLTLGLEARIIRPKVAIDGLGTVDRTPILAASAGLAVVFMIP